MEFQRVSDIKRKEYILTRLSKHVPQGSSVLDFGCGNGIITNSIARFGFNATGIDNSPEAISTASAFFESPNCHFAVLAPYDFKPVADEYEAIVLSEVLEHLVAPQQLLQQLFIALKNDGILVVTVPNGLGPRELLVTRPVQALTRIKFLEKILMRIKQLLGYSGKTIQSDAHDLRHRQFFTVASLELLASASGFTIVEWEKSNFIEQVFPFSLVFNRSQKLQRLDCNIASKLPLQFTSAFMTVWKKKTMQL
jgi:2-polyprenyl-3-methyl-5-hydroxy-6-metoxy-1,4-benzoquinol methylase